MEKKTNWDCGGTCVKQFVIKDSGWIDLPMGSPKDGLTWWCRNVGMIGAQVAGKEKKWVGIIGMSPFDSIKSPFMESVDEAKDFCDNIIDGIITEGMGFGMIKERSNHAVSQM